LDQCSRADEGQKERDNDGYEIKTFRHGEVNCLISKLAHDFDAVVIFEPKLVTLFNALLKALNEFESE
jgi:hypothetical protein